MSVTLYDDYSVAITIVLGSYTVGRIIGDIISD